MKQKLESEFIEIEREAESGERHKNYSIVSLF